MIPGLDPSAGAHNSTAAAAAAIHGTRFSGIVSTALAQLTYVIISAAEQDIWRSLNSLVFEF